MFPKEINYYCNIIEESWPKINTSGEGCITPYHTMALSTASEIKHGLLNEVQSG